MHSLSMIVVVVLVVLEATLDDARCLHLYVTLSVPQGYLWGQGA